MVFVAVLIGCDSAEPEEEEVEEIRRLVLVLEGADGSSQSAEVLWMDGMLAEVKTLLLDPRVAYTGSIRLFTTEGRDLTSQIQQEAEAYQVFYTLTGLPSVEFSVTDRESDYGPDNLGADYQVGLAYDVDVSYQAGDPTEGTLRVQLGHFVDELKSVRGLTVEPLLDVTLPVRINVATGPAPREEVYGFALRLGGSRVQTASDTPLIDVVVGARIGIARGTVVGSVEFFNRDGEDITPQIEEANLFYQVFYTPLPPVDDLLEITVTDEDFAGLPLGLTFEATLPDEGLLPDMGSVRVQLARYDPDAGQVKDGQTPSSDLLMNVVVPLNMPPSSSSR